MLIRILHSFLNNSINAIDYSNNGTPISDPLLKVQSILMGNTILL